MIDTTIPKSLLSVYGTPQSIPDESQPLPFSSWVRLNPALIPEQEVILYNQYLRGWYQEKQDKQPSYATQIRLRYLQLLSQLQVFFNKEETENWYRQVDITSDKEVLLAIPYFAKKLKELALFYLRSRGRIKDTKLQYNLTGTERGLALALRELFLYNFTKDGDEVKLPSTLWQKAPSLSAVKDTFRVVIEEFYEENNSLSAYDVSSSLWYTDFLKEKNLEDTDWVALLETGTLDLSEETLESLWTPENLDLSQTPFYESVDALNSYNQWVQKIMGSDVVTVAAAPSSIEVQEFNLELEEGWSEFFWPIGAQSAYASSLGRLVPVSLSSMEVMKNGTSGEELSSSDLLFVEGSEGVEGAWYCDAKQIITPVPFKVSFPTKSIQSFRYPFPGRGLSGEDVSWTGVSTVQNNTYLYLPKIYRDAIDNAYWGDSLSTSACNDLYFQTEYPLLTSGNSSYNPISADEIWIRENTSSDFIVKTNTFILGGWNYRSSNIEWPINRQKNNTFFWPPLSAPESSFRPLLSANREIGSLETPLSSLRVAGMMGGTTPANSDLLFKVPSLTSTEDQATEAYWFQGVSKTAGDLTLLKQNGFSLRVNPFSNQTFVWSASTQALSSLFTGVSSSDTILDLSSFGPLAGDKVVHTFIEYPTVSANSTFNASWSGTLTHLASGNTYTYFRNQEVPLTFIKDLGGSKIGQWRRAWKDPQTKQWKDVPDSNILDRKLKFGETWLYKPAKQNFCTFTSWVTSDDIAYAENKGSFWVYQDYVLKSESVPVIYNYIDKDNTLAPSNQKPSIPLSQIFNFRWQITYPDASTKVFWNRPSISMFPLQEGTYTAAVTAFYATDFLNLSGTSAIDAFSNIPPVTAVPYFQVPEEKKISWDLSNFAITCPLTASYWGLVTLDNFGQFKNYNTDYIQNEVLLQNPPLHYDLKVSYGQELEYRNKGRLVNWESTVGIKNTQREPLWCSIDSVSAINLKTPYRNLTVSRLVGSNNPSPITLTNLKDVTPQRIYYLAQNYFSETLNLTAIDPLVTEAAASAIDTLKASTPWSHLNNRYLPSVSYIPKYQLGLKSALDYFTGNDKLGALMYLDGDFTLTINTDLSAGQRVVQSPLAINGSKETYWNVEYAASGSRWMKEPFASGGLKGNIKKSLVDNFAEFIGYDNKKGKDLGLVTPNSRQSPWGGYQDAVWADLKNYPKSFIGEVNVDAWAQSQILKNTNKTLISYSDDLYGNQYGLYSDGELWVKKTNGLVQTAALALSAVYQSVQTYPNLLTSIQETEIYYDVIYLRSSSGILLDKLDYNYETGEILKDQAKTVVIGLSAGVQIHATPNYIIPTGTVSVGEKWFFDSDKVLLMSFAYIANSVPVLELITYNLNNGKCQNLYSVSLSANADSVHEPKLRYDEFTGHLWVGFTGTYSGDPYLATLQINLNSENVELVNWDWYQKVDNVDDLPSLSAINLIVELNEYFEIFLPPNASYNTTLPTGVSLLGNRIFGSISNVGNYDTTIQATNEFGNLYQPFYIQCLPASS